MIRQGSQPGQPRSFIAFFLSACLLANASLSCVRLPRRFVQASSQTRLIPLREAADTSAINLNAASAEELEKLPGIGRGLAARIIAYRNEYGHFRRPEHLMMVRGISVRRFHAVQALITAE